MTIGLLWCLIRLKKFVNRKLRWMWWDRKNWWSIPKSLALWRIENRVVMSELINVLVVCWRRQEEIRLRESDGRPYQSPWKIEYLVTCLCRHSRGIRNVKVFCQICVGLEYIRRLATRYSVKEGTYIFRYMMWAALTLIRGCHSQLVITKFSRK